MNKVYSRINWENEPSTKTPLNEHNLNKIDFAVDEIDNRVIELDSTKAKNTDLQTLSTRVDNLILNAGDSSAECTDARVTEDGTTYDTLKKRLDAEHSSVIEDISQLSNEVNTLNTKCFEGYQYLKTINRKVNQYYEHWDKVVNIEEAYYTYEPIVLSAGTYNIYGISYPFSWVLYEDGTAKNLLELTGIEYDMTITSITFEENVTVYITGFKLSFDNFPMITNNYLPANNLEGMYGDIHEKNLSNLQRWRNGSFHYSGEGYFDSDYRYITSYDFEFPFDVVIENTDTTNYLYYIAYIDTPIENSYVNYDNVIMKIIPANTKFRVGIKYLDDRILTESEQVYLRSEAIIIHNETDSAILKLDLIIKSIEGNENEEKVYIRVGADGDFSTIQEALNNITDVSGLKKYEILVSKGIYDISEANIEFLPLLPHVHIKGENKANTIIRFYSSDKNANKNVFQNHASLFKGGTAEVSNFTIVTENIKGALHLDSQSWSGTVYFHDVIIDDISSEEEFDSTLDYYQYMRASVGAINLATHIGQKIIIENVQTNGYIYSHSLPSNFTNMETENGGIFEVRNCTCDWIGIYGNGEAVRKQCILEGNKCHFIKVAFIDNYNLDHMCWEVVLKNNMTDFIAMQYFKYEAITTMKSLTNEYYGRFPFSDPNLHNVIQNTSGTDIPFGSKVKYTDFSRRYISLATNDDYDAVAVENITNGMYGVVQEGGNKEHYLEYLKTHELN